MEPRRDRLFSAVPGNSVVTSEIPVPNGEMWGIEDFSGAAAYLPDVEAQLIWDYNTENAEILAATHGDATIYIGREIVGDGTKLLAIVLDNGTSKEQTIGASWEGVKL